MEHAANQTIDAKDDIQFVTLGIDQEVFGVPVETVEEILDIRPVFRVPDAPVYLAGLIDVRGRGVPVIDLRVKLGLPAIAATANTRIVVLQIALNGRSLLLGLIADRVFEVATINAQHINPPPDIGVKWRSDYIKGVAHRGDGFVIIFDLVRLFSTDEIAVLGRTASRNSDAASAQPDSQAAMA